MMMMIFSNFYFDLFYFIFENRADYAITWTNYVERGSSQMTIWRMRNACCINKARHAHSQYLYVKLIAFPLQHWLQERASTLLVYVHWLSCFTVSFAAVLPEDDLL